MTTGALLNLVRDCGAVRASAIGQSDVVYSAAFRDLCAQNSCGLYGTCHMCPPDIGPIEALIEKAQQYPACIMYQTVSALEDSFDFEGMMEAKRSIIAVRSGFRNRFVSFFPVRFSILKREDAASVPAARSLMGLRAASRTRRSPRWRATELMFTRLRCTPGCRM